MIGLTQKIKLGFGGEAVLIAAASLIGYLTSFFHQYGYLSYFGLGAQFIELNTNSIILSITITFFAYLYLLSLLDALLAGDSVKSKGFKTLVVLSLFFLFACAAVVMAFELTLAIAVVFVLIVLFLAYLSLLKNKKPKFLYSALVGLPKKNAKKKVQRHGLIVQALDTLDKKYGLALGLVLIFVMAHGFISYFSGYLGAKTIENHWVVNLPNQKLIAIYITNGKVIALPYFSADNSFKEEIHYYSLEELQHQDTPLVKEELGRLKNKRDVASSPGILMAELRQTIDQLHHYIRATNSIVSITLRLSKYIQHSFLRVSLMAF